MRSFYENAQWEPNPYASLNDGHNAIDEYFALKHMLCLTDAERFVLKYRRPYPIEFDYIQRLWKVKEKYQLTISQLAELLRISRKTLSRVLNNLEVPGKIVKQKILKFLEGINV